MNITIIKKNILGEETWRYQGQVLNHDSVSVVLEAYFNRPDMPFHEITLKQGDRFIEIYFTNRWYNVFKIYDRDENDLKGWYCNLSYPARIEQKEDGWMVSYVDLALDLLVYPDGRQVILDEDEFMELPLSPEDRNQVQQALAELMEYVRNQSDLTSSWR